MNKYKFVITEWEAPGIDNSDPRLDKLPSAFDIIEISADSYKNAKNIYLNYMKESTNILSLNIKKINLLSITKNNNQ